MKKTLGYVVRWVNKDGRDPRSTPEYINSEGNFTTVRHMFPTKAEAQSVVHVWWPGHQRKFRYSVGDHEGCRVFRVVRTVRHKVKPGTIGYVVGFRKLDDSGWEYKADRSFSAGPRKVFAKRWEAEDIARGFEGRKVLAVVRKPKPAPVTPPKYVVKSTVNEGCYLGVEGWMVYGLDKAVRFNNVPAAFEAYKKAGLCSNPTVVPVLVEPPPPRMRPRPAGYIIRKRHPHVFTSRSEALRKAAEFGDCKVIPIKAGHEALR